MRKISMYVPQESFDYKFHIHGGMATYCSNMIREYSRHPDVVMFPNDRKYGRFRHPISTVGVYHNLNGFSLENMFTKFPPKTHKIITIHDVQELIYPENFSAKQISERKEVYKWINKNRPTIIFISNFTRIQFIEKLSIDDTNMYVIPHAFDHLRNGNAEAENFNWYTSQRYFYVPGRGWRHKGQMNLLNSLPKYLDFFRDNDLKLYMSCTPSELGADLIKWIEEHQANDVLFMLPELSNQQHLEILENAALVLLPSTYEGFGFSYGEGIYMNKKVVAFNLPPYAEISKCGYLVEIGNFGELIKKAIEVFVNPGVVVEDNTIYGRTWKTNVNHILEIVQS